MCGYFTKCSLKYSIKVLTESILPREVSVKGRKIFGGNIEKLLWTGYDDESLSQKTREAYSV